MSAKWGRDDDHKWWRDYQRQLLQECGCEEEDYSVYGDGMYQPELPINLKSEVLNLNNVDAAMCPDSYSKSAEIICNNPHEVLESIRPLMRQIGVGCPQSFALALADMFQIAMETGVVKAFNTDEII